MSEKIHVYAGAAATVTWDATRCIHAAECVRRVPQSFDPAARPWIRCDNAAADALADAVNACPSGALAMTRADGTSAMVAYSSTTCEITVDGPYHVRGHLALKQGDTISPQTRMALCRCGASRNKPFCDNSHEAAGFHSSVTLRAAKPAPANANCADTVTFTPTLDGPLQFNGAMMIRDADGIAAFVESGYLCRCGGSQNKPYCDGTHRKIGFIG